MILIIFKPVKNLANFAKRKLKIKRAKKPSTH